MAARGSKRNWTVCASRMHQQAITFIKYAHANDDYFQPAASTRRLGFGPVRPVHQRTGELQRSQASAVDSGPLLHALLDELLEFGQALLDLIHIDAGVSQAYVFLRFRGQGPSEV